jgi:hypothetical protein
MAGPALFLGKVGSTGGTSTGPHAHWEVMKDGKRFPLSKARKDIGQYIQFRLPNQESWQQLYSPESQGFRLNPAATITSPMGPRTAPSPGASTDHKGEDYGFPAGTALRFLGQGSVSTHAGQGAAGNVSALRTGPYELQTFHLSELPQAATTRRNEAAAGATGTTAGTTPEAWAQAYVQNQIENQTQQGKLIDALINVIGEKEKPKSLMEQMKEGLIGGALQQALTPKNFLSQFTGSDPYLQGQQYATSQFFGL